MVTGFARASLRRPRKISSVARASRVRGESFQQRRPVHDDGDGDRRGFHDGWNKKTPTIRRRVVRKANVESGAGKTTVEQSLNLAESNGATVHVDGRGHHLVVRALVVDFLPVPPPSGPSATCGRNLPSRTSCRERSHVYFISSRLGRMVRDPMSVRRKPCAAGRRSRRGENLRLRVRRWRQGPQTPRPFCIKRLIQEGAI